MKRKFTKVDKQNIDFLRKISPRTAPHFFELIYTNGNQYCTCLQIIDFPEEIGCGFMNRLINMKNVFVTVDEDTIGSAEITNFLGKNVDNKNNDASTQQKFKDYFKSGKEAQRSGKFLQEIDSTKNSAKCITLRLYVYERTEELLQKAVDDILDTCKQLKAGAYIQTNDLASDYQAISKLDNPIKEIVSSDVITKWQMLNGATMIKPAVSIMGITDSGVYAEDILSYAYSSFCCMILGLQGSGKSSLFKSIAEDAILRGDNVYIFDIHFSEYAELINKYQIASVSFSDKHYLNGFEIYAINDVNRGVISKFDVTSVKNLMTESIKSLSTSAEIGDGVIRQLRKLMSTCYDEYIGKKLSDFTHEDWFVASDLKKVLLKNKEMGLYPQESKDDIYNLGLILDELIDDYDFLFDKHTNIDIDLSKSLHFDLAFLNDLKDNRIESSYIALLMSYIQKAMNLNELYNNKVEKGKVKSSLVRPEKSGLVIFDEWSRYAQNVPYLIKCNEDVKQSRKARFAFLFAIHTLNDVILDNNVAKELIKSIFDLTAIKIIGESDLDTINLLPKYVKALDKMDLEIIKTFKKGANGERSFFAVNNLNEKIKFDSLITPRQQAFFGGGV